MITTATKNWVQEAYTTFRVAKVNKINNAYPFLFQLLYTLLLVQAPKSHYISTLLTTSFP